MKIDFNIPTDNQYHELCIDCHQEAVQAVKEEGQTFYLCSACGHKSARIIVFDPKIISWVDPVTKEYWHESAGIFVFNQANQALFFKRSKFPFVYTIPAGHLEAGETAEQAVRRELLEEAGLAVEHEKLVVTEDVANDQCRRGADYHRWHQFVAYMADHPAVTIKSDEGDQPIWLTLEQALLKELSVPVRLFIEKYGKAGLLLP
jgi:ADP-ribose pyrophosphatase YjhB (NUDIX family)